MSFGHVFILTRLISALSNQKSHNYNSFKKIPIKSDICPGLKWKLIITRTPSFFFLSLCDFLHESSNLWFKTPAQALSSISTLQSAYKGKGREERRAVLFALMKLPTCHTQFHFPWPQSRKLRNKVFLPGDYIPR